MGDVLTGIEVTGKQRDHHGLDMEDTEGHRAGHEHSVGQEQGQGQEERCAWGQDLGQGSKPQPEPEGGLQKPLPLSFSHQPPSDFAQHEDGPGQGAIGRQGKRSKLLGDRVYVENHGTHQLVGGGGEELMDSPKESDKAAMDVEVDAGLAPSSSKSVDLESSGSSALVVGIVRGEGNHGAPGPVVQQRQKQEGERLLCGRGCPIPCEPHQEEGLVMEKKGKENLVPIVLEEGHQQLQQQHPIPVHASVTSGSAMGGESCSSKLTTAPLSNNDECMPPEPPLACPSLTTSGRANGVGAGGAEERAPPPAPGPKGSTKGKGRGRGKGEKDNPNATTARDGSTLESQLLSMMTAAGGVARIYHARRGRKRPLPSWGSRTTPAMTPAPAPAPAPHPGPGPNTLGETGLGVGSVLPAVSTTCPSDEPAMGQAALKGLGTAMGGDCPHQLQLGKGWEVVQGQGQGPEQGHGSPPSPECVSLLTSPGLPHGDSERDCSDIELLSRRSEWEGGCSGNPMEESPTKSADRGGRGQDSGDGDSSGRSGSGAPCDGEREGGEDRAGGEGTGGEWTCRGLILPKGKSGGRLRLRQQPKVMQWQPPQLRQQNAGVGNVESNCVEEESQIVTFGEQYNPSAGWLYHNPSD
ncbi:unnamed protein product [Discosporangium mesarthrocarpum]